MRTAAGTGATLHPDEASAPEPRRERPLWASVQALWRDLGCLVGDRVELLSLELQRARQALALIVLWMALATIFGLSGWLGLCGAAVWLMLQQGLHWGVAMGVVALFNLLLGAWAVGRAKALVPQMALPATRRHLHFGEDEGAATDVRAPVPQ